MNKDYKDDYSGDLLEDEQLHDFAVGSPDAGEIETKLKQVRDLAYAIGYKHGKED